MGQVRYTNKKTGVTYVYDSISYWDPELKQPRAHRTLIGKVDPETGEVVPTGKKGGVRQKKSVEEKAAIRKAKLAKEKVEEAANAGDATDYKKLYEDALKALELQEKSQEASLQSLQAANADLESRLKKAKAELKRIESQLQKVSLLLGE